MDLDSQSFLSWSSLPSGIFWIEGKAGSGKSVLAKTIRSRIGVVSTLGAQGIPLPPVGDWFYSTRHGKVTRSHTSFLRSVLGQILQQNQASFQHYAAIYRRKRENNEDWTMEDYVAVLRELSRCGLAAICIVDAVDESEDNDGTFELRSCIIALMGELCDRPSSRLKFLVLSRYTADISKALRKYGRNNRRLAHLVLERENSGDIANLVENGLAVLRCGMSVYDSDTDSGESNDDKSTSGLEASNTSSIPTGNDNSRITSAESKTFSRMREYLMENSNGVILWVKLALQALHVRVRKAFYKLEDLESDLKSLPKEIIDFYKLAVADLENRYTAEGLQRTRTTLMWVVGASAIRPLALGELHEALCVPDASSSEPAPAGHNFDPIADSPTRVYVRSWLGFYRQLRVRCGSLVEVSMPPNQGTGSNFIKDTEIKAHFTIQLLHRTAKDFLMSLNDSGSLSFHQKEADDFVRQSMHIYLEHTLPRHSVVYCPVPTREGHDMSDISRTVPAIVQYLEGRNLLEFVLTAMPEDDLMPHLMIFERSCFPPLLELPGGAWDKNLHEVSFAYFDYACHHGLARAMVNLLALSSVLLISWPMLLRYGPLATALKRCSLKFRDAAVVEDDADNAATVGEDGTSSPIDLNADERVRLNIMEVIEMITAFSDREQDIFWECKGVLSMTTRVLPQIRDLTDVIEQIEWSHGRRQKPRREIESTVVAESGSHNDLCKSRFRIPRGQGSPSAPEDYRYNRSGVVKGMEVSQSEAGAQQPWKDLFESPRSRLSVPRATLVVVGEGATPSAAFLDTYVSD